MSNLYLVRHGHTVVADEGIVAGFNNVDLSTRGKASLLELKNSIGQLNFDAYFATDLIRTQQSMALLTDSQYLIDARIKELNFGDWEGMSWNTVHEKYPEQLNSWSDNWVDNRPPNGETFTELAHRCNSWLAEQPIEDNHCALVTAHGGSIRALLCLALKLPMSAAMQFDIDHASVTKLVLSEHGNRCAFLNRIRFDDQ